VLATVFYDRVELGTRGGDISGVLGLAIAHELGHLLLGSGEHIDEGIMRPHWTRKDLHRDRRHLFLFTSEQAERIRTKISTSRAKSAMNSATLSSTTRGE